MKGDVAEHRVNADPRITDRRRHDYATRFARNVVGNAELLLPSSLAETIANALSRAEELANPVRDEWGNWESRFNQRTQNEPDTEPWIDELLRVEYSGDGAGASREPTWPEGRPFALCLTHDVDGVSSRNHAKKFVRRVRRIANARGQRQLAAYQALGSVFRLVSGFGRPDRLGRFEEWLDLEAEHGFHSTWYFLPSKYPRPHVYDMDYEYGDVVVFRGQEMSVADMIRAIRNSGGDIGVHGSYHSIEDTDLLRSERKQVEETVGESLVSVRQHFLRYDSRLTPSLHERVGFQCDSTVGFNSSIGFRAGTSFPYWAWNHQENRPARVLEIPLHIMDAALVRIALSSVDAALRKAFTLMDRVVRVGGCLTLNWHPNLIDRPPFFEIYRSIVQEAALRGAWGCSCSELRNWWVAREQRLQLASV